MAIVCYMKEQSMKRSPVIPLFISVHVFCIILQIYKHSLFVQASYTKQKYELERENLLQQKQHLSQEMQTLKNHTHVKQYAQQKLKMDTLKLKQIKKLHDHETTI